jgi:anti-repressor protein
MDIVRAFEATGAGLGFNINIQGTPEDPLFQANQIGTLLGMVNIRETLRDFDDDETRVSSTDTNRSATFITELGLYRLLGMSRKPFARPFQKWVARVVKEIRLTGKFEADKLRLRLYYMPALQQRVAVPP